LGALGFNETETASAKYESVHAPRGVPGFGSTGSVHDTGMPADGRGTFRAGPGERAFALPLQWRLFAGLQPGGRKLGRRGAEAATAEVGAKPKPLRPIRLPTNTKVNRLALWVAFASSRDRRIKREGSAFLPRVIGLGVNINIKILS
jgi:hypothetical protein